MSMQAPNLQPSRDPSVVVLLTACIRPGAIIALARRDVAVRLNDYRTALEKWVKVRGVDGIVFCDNSGADLSALESIAKEATIGGPVFEFLSFQGQDFDPALGKGYGEMQIIRHALKHSKLIGSSTLVIKITGRFFIRNIAAIVRDVAKNVGNQLFCDLRVNLTTSDSRVFCATPAFLNDYLLPYQVIINDSQGICFENALARAAHRAMADGHFCSPLPVAHRMQGVTGTTNECIPDGLANFAKRELFRRFKGFVLRQ